MAGKMQVFTLWAAEAFFIPHPPFPITVASKDPQMIPSVNYEKENLTQLRIIFFIIINMVLIPVFCVHFVFLF